MPVVKNLTKTFYDDIKNVTTPLREGLLPQDYTYFYKLVRDKKLSKATRYLEGLYEEYCEINVYQLETLRDREGEETMRSYIVFRIEMRQWLAIVVRDWIGLMIKNGGSRKAGKLARASKRSLPLTKPWTYSSG